MRQPSSAAKNELAAVAAELHDGPMQQLAFFGYAIDVVDRKLANGQIDDAIGLLRDVRSGLTRELGTLRRLVYGNAADGYSDAI